MSLRDQAALVVGGANGIGLATVKELLREGANVTVIDISKRGEAIVKDLQSEFVTRKCLFLQADVCSDEEMEVAFSTARNLFQRLDIVIISSGICNEVEWNLGVDVNLKGVIRGTFLAWDHMGKQGGGSGGTLINIASIAGLMSSRFTPIYTATKHAVIGFSRSCGEPYHLDRTGVRVITICPGLTDTPLLKQSRLKFAESEEVIKESQSKYIMQSATNVAKGVVQVIHNAKSGSVWVSEEDKPAWEVIFPAYKDMCAKQ